MSERLHRTRELLGASTRVRREEDDEDAFVDQVKRIGPSKLTADDLREQPGAAASRQGSAGKLRRDEVDASTMTAEESLAYSSWVLSPHRGWADGGIARRAVPGGNELADEGVLATAFSFVNEVRGGFPLPAPLLDRLSRELGVDLSRVRLHTDERAVRAAQALSAKAFTIGDDVYFGANAYDPSSEDGIELIAHECAHVAQNHRGGGSNSQRVSRPEDAHERDADAFAQRFARGARRTFTTSDPAELVEHVRKEGRRVDLPFQDELERHFGQSLDFVQTFTGEAATLACQMMAAGAFAVRNIVALADPSPRRDLMLHELTHIVQMGGASAQAPARFEAGSVTIGVSGSSVEREAERHPERPTLTADANVIHRGGGGSGDTSTDDGKPIDRVKAYAANVKIEDNSKDKKRKEISFAFKDGKSYFPRYGQSAAAPFNSGAYTNGDSKRKDSDLEDVWKVESDATNLGDGKRLHKVDGGGYVLTGGSDTYKPTVTNIKLQPTPEWTAYLSALEALEKEIPDFQWGDNNLSKYDASITDSEIKDYRHKLTDAIASVPEFVTEKGSWKKFHTKVVAANLFKRPYKRIVGNIFEALVGKSTKKDDSFPMKDVQLAFEFNKAGVDYKCFADGVITPKNWKVGEAKMLAEAKAWTKGPGATEREQMRTYKAIIDDPAVMYQGAEEDVKNNTFNHVAYYFSDSKVSKKWLKALQEEFGVKDEALTENNYFSMVPPPEGSTATFKVKYNPEFEIPVKPGQTHVDLTSPPISHAGLKVTKLVAELDDAGAVKSGSITAGLDAANGALKAPPETKPLTPGDGGVGAVENKFDGLTSTLSKALGDKVQIDAKLVNDGLQATVTIAAPQKGVGGFTLKPTVVTLKYTDKGDFVVTGTVGVERDINKGKVSGDLTISWASGGWGLSGQVTATDGVVDGLKAFSGGFDYEGEQLTIRCDTAQIEKKFKAVTLTGTATNVTYNAKTEMFSGTARLDADLGMFGHASGTATLKDNKLTKAELSYDSPELKYPAKSEKPTFKGTIGGTIGYENGQFSGAIHGTANLVIPALEKFTGEGGAGLKVEAHINADGSYGGTIGTTTPIKFGDHFQVDKVSCTLKDDGSVNGNFKISIVKIKYFENASIACTVDENGVTIDEAAITAKVGSDKDKLWGSLTASYKKAEGLKVTGNINYKIKEGMVAKGTLTYSSQDNKLTVSLGVDRIELLKYGPVTKHLFGISKQIPLVSIYGLGIYLDIGFDLDFQYEMDLGMTPTVTLDGLSLDDFSFKSISADIQLDGALIARLIATPKVGLGLFALSPSLLRGGGGIKIPITGEAALRPKALLHVQYDPQGGVTGDAQVGMSLTFGIKGEVKPYAELSVLDGAWNPSWEGEALASFEIMPPKELFNFNIDLGKDQKKEEPKIPDSPGAPGAGGPGKQLPQEEPTKKEAGGGAANKDAEVPTSGPSGDGGGLPDDPIKLSSMLSGVKNLPGFQTISKIMAKAGAAWEAIKGFFGRVVKTFKSFFDGLASMMEEIVDGFSSQGLGYLPVLIKKIVGEGTWNIIEPIITALGGVGEKLLGLFEGGPPTSIADFFPWALKKASDAWGMAWSSIGSVISAVGTMMDRLGQAAVKIISGLVSDGKLGVRRHTYYIWKPIGKNWYFFAADEYKINVLGFSTSFRNSGMLLSPSNAVAFGLWDAFENMGVAPTGGYDDPDVGENSRDRWV